MKYIVFETKPGEYSWDDQNKRPVAFDEVRRLSTTARELVIWQTWRDYIPLLSFHTRPGTDQELRQTELRFAPVILYQKGEVRYPPFLADPGYDIPEELSYDPEIEAIEEVLDVYRDSDLVEERFVEEA